MIALIQNENIKLMRRPRTWIFVGLIALALVAMWMVIYTTDQKSGAHDMTAWHFADAASNLMTIITIFVAVIAGDMVAGEFSSGAIKLLLVRPASRAKILWAKYTSVLLFGFLFIVFLLVASLILGGLAFGFDGANAPAVHSDGIGKSVTVPMGLDMIRSYAFAAVPMMMTVTVSFMISVLFRSSSLAIAISILLLFVGSSISMLLQRYDWDKYVLFTNENLSQYITGEPLIPGMTMLFSVVVLCGYFILFHIVAWVAFSKRDITS